MIPLWGIAVWTLIVGIIWLAVVHDGESEPEEQWSDDGGGCPKWRA